VSSTLPRSVVLMVMPGSLIIITALVISCTCHRVSGALAFVSVSRAPCIPLFSLTAWARRSGFAVVSCARLHGSGTRQSAVDPEKITAATARDNHECRQKSQHEVNQTHESPATKSPLALRSVSLFATCDRFPILSTLRGRRAAVLAAP